MWSAANRLGIARIEHVPRPHVGPPKRVALQGLRQHSAACGTHQGGLLCYRHPVGPSPPSAARCRCRSARAAAGSTLSVRMDRRAQRVAASSDTMWPRLLARE